ncbi:hypothetical protein BVRB_027780 [Beta vulgaris subsp. vulgaris]|uniref:Uncharacterized protein n=1 Tax=Beta vulgaris subsp. vulgaris TaxID=3555 RepID=A0A0J8DSS5_BETVV|nr:hypothetical protein BVRB_027780 [Beta vulgaris subsp. vulgaris]
MKAEDKEREGKSASDFVSQEICMRLVIVELWAVAVILMTWLLVRERRRRSGPCYSPRPRSASPITSPQSPGRQISNSEDLSIPVLSA